MNKDCTRFFRTITVYLGSLGSVLTLVSPALAQQPSLSTQPLTLAQAITLSLHQQPSLQNATASRQGSEQRLKQAQARYYPTLTPQYSYQAGYTYGGSQGVTGVGNTLNTGNSVTTTTREALLGLNYRLWDSGTRDLQARQSRQSLRAATAGESDQQQTVIANVADAYFSSLKNDALVKVAQSQVERAQNTLAVVKAQVAAGVAAQKDTYQAEADLLNAQVNLLQSQNNAALAQASLKNAVGIVSENSFPIQDVSAPSAGTPMTATTESGSAATVTLTDLMRTALRSRPDILQARQNLEVSQTSVSLARVSAQPQLTTDLSAGNNLDPVSLKRSVSNDRTISLGLTYPLFDGGSARAKVHENEATVRQSAAQLETLRQQVAIAVEQAYRNLTVARVTLPSAESAQKAAQINYDAAIASRRQGVGSIVEVITAQTSLVQAQTSYVQAIYNFYSADAQLARAVGQADRIATIGTGTAPTRKEPQMP